MSKIESILASADELFSQLETLSEVDKIDAINRIRRSLSKHSPFQTEPIDCVEWVLTDTVVANDYNPNSVAPPEMQLLELSIKEDGYTQPVVTWQRELHREVVDGFHRTRVAKESAYVRGRVKGYVPVVTINQGRQELTDRMAATIRHNRARGKHNVDSMSDIVVELKKRNRSEEWIARHLGMDADEVLRLCQVSGLIEMFANSEFSKSWDIDATVCEDTVEELQD